MRKVGCGSYFSKVKWELIGRSWLCTEKEKNDWSAWKVRFGLIKMNIHPVCLLKSPQMLGGIWYYNFPIQWPFLDYFQQNQLLLRYGICISLFEFFFTSILILWCLETLQIIIYFGVMRQQIMRKGFGLRVRRLKLNQFTLVFKAPFVKWEYSLLYPIPLYRLKGEII